MNFVPLLTEEQHWLCWTFPFGNHLLYRSLNCVCGIFFYFILLFTFFSVDNHDPHASSHYTYNTSPRHIHILIINFLKFSKLEAFNACISCLILLIGYVKLSSISQFFIAQCPSLGMENILK